LEYTSTIDTRCMENKLKTKFAKKKREPREVAMEKPLR
jgi:hypothetical protein